MNYGKILIHPHFFVEEIVSREDSTGIIHKIPEYFSAADPIESCPEFQVLVICQGKFPVKGTDVSGDIFR